MPLTDDQKAIAFATLVPGASTLISCAIVMPVKDSVMNWWKGLKKPVCCTPSEDYEIAVHSALSLLTAAPLVYATYKVYKEGAFDYDDTKKALACYGLVGATLIPNALAKKKQCVKCLFVSTAAIFGASCLTSYTYHEVQKEFGYLTLPFTALMGFYTIYLYKIMDMNKEEDKETAKEE